MHLSKWLCGTLLMHPQHHRSGEEEGRSDVEGEEISLAGKARLERVCALRSVGPVASGVLTSMDSQCGQVPHRHFLPSKM